MTYYQNQNAPEGWSPEHEGEIKGVAFGVAIPTDFGCVLLNQLIKDADGHTICVVSHLTVLTARQMAAKLMDYADEVERRGVSG